MLSAGAEPSATVLFLPSVQSIGGGLISELYGRYLDRCITKILWETRGLNFVCGWGNSQEVTLELGVNARLGAECQGLKFFLTILANLSGF